MNNNKNRVHEKTRPSRFRRFFTTPKGLAVVILSLTGLVASLATQKIDTNALIKLVIGAGTGYVVDLLVGLFYTKRRFFSDGGIITGLIVAMVLGSLTPVYVTVTTTAIALISKHVLRWKRKPIFNPAAFGLLVANYLFVCMQSWWGGMSLVSNWYLAALVVGGILLTKRVKKFPQVLAFVFSYLFLCLTFMRIKPFHDDALFGLQNPMLNSALFLAFFMITDPPTSPSKWRSQVIFGCIVAILGVGVYLMDPAELTYLLIGLLVANCIKFVQSLVLNSSKSRNSHVVLDA